MTAFLPRTAIFAVAILLNVCLAGGQGDPPATNAVGMAPAPKAEAQARIECITIDEINSIQVLEPYADDEPFQALSEDNLRQVRRQLDEAVERLTARLDQDGPNGKAWKAYLKWDAFLDQLRTKGPLDPEKLDAVYSRLDASYPGLELVWFVDVRQALKHYLNIARGIDNPEIAAAYDKLMKTLPKRLKSYANNPTPREAAVIGQIVGWLEDFGQGKQMIGQIRERLRHPNLMIRMSSPLVSAGFEDKVDDTSPVHDVILGTTVHGTGHTIGTVTATLSDDPQDAAIELLFRGQTESSTIGRNGPVRIHSQGLTDLEARKQVVFDAEGIRTMPSVADASTSTDIQSIQAVRGGRFVERIAWRRACRDKGRAEAIASCHAEAKLNRRINEEADAKVAKANEDFRTKVRAPLFARRVWPEMLQFKTSKDALHVVVLQAGSAQLAALAAPPELTGESDLAVRVHESMINNGAETLLAGRTLSEDEFLKTVKDILGEVPERLQAQKDAEPWAISFASVEPFTVTFAENGFVVAIRANAWFRGDSEYPPMNVTAAYKIERDKHGLVAVRQGDLAVFPPNFKQGKDKLSAREQTIRRLLTDRLDRVLEAKLKPRGVLELRGQWKKAGSLQLDTWQTAKGWMILTWQRAAK
ncbi:MAG: hypothetical protein JW818_20705 [Pirellulales bacterium]|nr:hypothetical protein [Pirellulales bacterium]